MKKIHIVAISVLITALLLGGCAEHGVVSAPSAENDSSLNSSESDASDSAGTLDNSSETESSLVSTGSVSSSSDNSNDSTSSSESSPEQSSDVSAEPVPLEFTDEDRDLQEILKDLHDITLTVSRWCCNDKPDDGNIELLLFLFPEYEYLDPHFYYELPDNYSEEDMVIPKTYNDFKELLLSFMTERYVEGEDVIPVTKGSMTEITGDSFTSLDEKTNGKLSSYSKRVDGFFSVVIDHQNVIPRFIETGGKMYRCEGEGGRGLEGIDIVDCDTAKVISRTDDTIEFTYLSTSITTRTDIDQCLYDMEQYKQYATVGVLKYERGGWKRDWDKKAKERWDAWQERLHNEQSGTSE